MNRQRSSRSTATLRKPSSSRPPRRQRPYLRKFHLEDLGRKDFLSGLTLWLVIEFVSFVLLPTLMQLKLGDRLNQWFWLSIPLGIGGALLMGASSRFVAELRESNYDGSKALVGTLGQLASGLAIVGILFPFLAVVGEFFSKNVFQP